MHPMDPIDFALRGDHITLDALLKATGLVDSGGAAKVLIAEGQVQVNGVAETRRGRKLRAGDTVAFGGMQVLLCGPAHPPSA
jgi:ribosome-associated protein